MVVRLPTPVEEGIDPVRMMDHMRRHASLVAITRFE